MSKVLVSQSDEMHNLNNENEFNLTIPRYHNMMSSETSTKGFYAIKGIPVSAIDEIISALSEYKEQFILKSIQHRKDDIKQE